jgi:HD-like signal output (HDOD) protein
MHQFLHKPCDSEALRGVIARTCGLQQLLQTEVIRGLIGKLDRLPSPPVIYLQLTQALANPDVHAREIASIVEGDPAMSAKLLQLVNSAYFGLAKRATSIQQAVTYLGVDMLKALSLNCHVFGTADGTPVGGVLDQLQKSSLATATLAKQIVRDRKRTDEAFTAGIVHDIGRLVIAVSLPERLREIRERAQAEGLREHCAEREVLGVTHAEIGAYLLGYWGVPFAITETVAFHHSPSKIAEGANDVLAAVHVASVLIDGVRLEKLDALPPDTLDLPFLTQNGMLEELPRWQAIADRFLGKLNDREQASRAPVAANR